MDEREPPESLSQYELKLREWISRWCDHAVAEGLVRPPFLLDEPMAERLEGYFFVGLTPAEGAQAFFGSVH
ncbi:hypothetical protein VSR69_40910 [Paraburkholderia phytofirmans]